MIGRAAQGEKLGVAFYAKVILPIVLIFRHMIPPLSCAAHATPASIRVNGTPRTLPHDGATIADLIRDMKLEGKRIAVERNGAIVPRSRYAESVLTAGDALEIVGAVGGG
jgi:sulfur carrier protein